MYDIITVGSATVDIFIDTGSRLFQKADAKGHIRVPFGSKILIERLGIDTGGGGTNTATAFARLGLRTAYIGKIGIGDNSERVIGFLKKEGISTEFISRDNKTRTGLSVILDAKGRERTILAYKGSNDDLRPRNINFKKLKTRWFYLCSMTGRSYKVLEGVSVFAKKNGIKVAFNPSSYLAKKGARFLSKVLKNTDVLIFNREEAELLVGKEKDTRKLIKKVHDKGPGVVVITEGDKNVYAYDGEKIYCLTPNHKKVVEATGAGDAFASGFVAGMAKGRGIEFCLQLGLAESESVITHYGAKNKLLKWGEAMRMIKKEPGRVKCL